MIHGFYQDLTINIDVRSGPIQEVRLDYTDIHSVLSESQYYSVQVYEQVRSFLANIVINGLHLLEALKTILRGVQIFFLDELQNSEGCNKQDLDTHQFRFCSIF